MGSISKRQILSQHSTIISDCHNFGIMVDSRELFLCPNLNNIIDEAMLDHVSASNFIRNLRILTGINKDAILIHMITCGGDWNYSMGIFDSIKDACNSGTEIVTLSYAHARSMSSIIPQAATTRIIMPNADFLIHDGTLNVEGGYRHVVSEVDQSKKSRDRMIEIYVERCAEGAFWKREGMDERAVGEWLGEQMDKRQEFYMTPQDAVDKGFMDGILGDEDFLNINTLRG